MATEEPSLIASPSKYNHDVFVKQIASAIHSYIAEVIQDMMFHQSNGYDRDVDDDAPNRQVDQSLVRRAIKRFVRGVKRLEGSQRAKCLAEIKPYVERFDLIYNPTIIFVAQSIFLHDTTGLRISSSLIPIDEFTLMCVQAIVDHPLIKTPLVDSWFNVKHPMASLSHTACISFIMTIVENCMMQLVYEYIRIASSDDEDNVFYGLEGMSAILQEEYNQHLHQLFEPVLNDVANGVYELRNRQGSSRPYARPDGMHPYHHDQNPYYPRNHGQPSTPYQSPYARDDQGLYGTQKQSPFAPLTPAKPLNGPTAYDSYQQRPWSSPINKPWQDHPVQNNGQAPAYHNQSPYSHPPVRNYQPAHGYPAYGNYKGVDPARPVSNYYGQDLLNNDQRYDAKYYQSRRNDRDYRRDDRHHRRRDDHHRRSDSRSKKHRRIKDSLSDFVSIDRSESSRSSSRSRSR